MEVYFMSLLTAANLLRQYNKNSPYGKDASTEINTTGSTRNTLKGTWAYANKYDALYNRYSTYKNFNLNTWLEALKLGEQDTYLAFLEQNKDTQMSDQFYDPQYYSYERNMLELSKVFADATSLDDREDGSSREYFEQVFDYEKNERVEQSIGKMTDRQYIDYTLSKNDEARAAEITRDLEQWRKDQLGGWGQLGHDILATLAEFGEGLLSGLTGIVDFVVAVGGLGLVPYAANGFEGNYLDAFVDYFGENGLTAAEKKSVRAALDEYERTHTHFRDIYGNYTGVGKYVAGIANSIGMMVPAIVANYFTGGASSLAWIGPTTFYASIFSNNMYENATDPARANSPSWLKIVNAATKTAVEAVIEWGLDKLLGGTIQNQLIGMGGKTAIKGLTKWTGIKYLLKSAGQEGLEEFLQDFSTNLVDQFIGIWEEGYRHTGVTFQTLIDSFCIGALSSVFMSGGAVVGSSIRSAIANKKAPGSGDLYIETEKGAQKVRGVNRLYYGQILSDFQKAVDQLKKGKLSTAKNLGLAQEVYGAVSAISQFYSSFDAQRIKNCEMLLDRVVKAEKKTSQEAFGENYERAASILSPETVGEIVAHDKVVRQQIKEQKAAEVKLKAQTLATYLESTFNEMVFGASLRHKKQFHGAVDENKDKLNEAGVTAARGVMDNNGELYMRDQAIEEAEEQISKLARDRLEELHKDYPFIIITDGHIALEEGEFLFVSEAWLENYETSEIYKFLAQSKVLKAIETDTLLKPMIDELIKFDKQFTKQENVTVERAIMDLLFNKSVYQAFLLSKVGKRDAGAMAFKKFIFRMHDIVKETITRSGATNWRGKPSQKRINFANQIYEQIKETMREPTIKAILNWNLDPQLIGADNVLTKTDHEFINQYQARKRTLGSAVDGKITSAFKNIANVIMHHASFDDTERAIVEKGMTDEATTAERLLAVALLNEADSRMTTYDFEHGMAAYHGRKGLVHLNNILKLEQSIDNSAEMNRHLSVLGVFLSGEIKFLLLEDSKVDEKWFAVANKYDEIVKRGVASEIYSATKQLAKPITELFNYAISTNKEIAPTTSGAFIIPPQAFLSENDLVEYIQFRADKLNEFQSTYGISARQMIIGDLTNMSMSQQRKMQEDMTVLGVDNIEDFVIRKLEVMLGPDYVVTPIYRKDNNFNEVFDFEIVTKIDADQLLFEELLGDSTEARNDLFYKFIAPGETRKLTDFLRIAISADDPALQRLNEWTVEHVVDADITWAGETDTDTRTIRINTAVSSDFVYTLVHEINHALQYEWHLTEGFNTDIAMAMPDLMKHVLQNYTEYVCYVITRNGYGRTAEMLRTAKANGKDLSKMLLSSSELKQELAYCTYRLIQGELWAQAYKHNGKIVKGYTMSQDIFGDAYVVSPDGKAQFKMPFTDGWTSRSLPADPNAKIDEEFTQRVFVDAFNNVLTARDDARVWGYNQAEGIRNTYHTKLQRMSSREVLSYILSDRLGITATITATIDDVVRNPEQYLSSEMLAKLNGKYDEGFVYATIKEYLENELDGISIDRDGATHEYILVDDNAFDDLLNSTTRQVANDVDSQTLYKKYADKPTSLNAFYNMMQLMRLGIGTNLKVVISPDVATETTFTDDNRQGTIYIQADEHTSDMRIVDALNHEFRHVMQRYNGFETGFTPDFVVTAEMLTDVKAHIPALFKDKRIVDSAKRIDPKNWEAFIVRQFVYSLTGGELNAYGIKSSLVNTKPIYVTNEAGKPTIFMPWYDAQTGEGRHKTDFLASRADDTPWYNQRGKKNKYKSKTQTGTDDKGAPVYTYEYTKRRDFNLKKAKGTNLEFFVKKGQRNQMDPDLQEFVVATTGHEDKLPPELVHAIKKGVLTKQALFKWFREADAESINDFTFDLLNDTMFHNEHVTSMDALDDLLVVDPSFYWAAVIVLRKHGLKGESILAENDPAKLRQFLSSLEGSQWLGEIEKKQIEFNEVWLEQRDGKYKKENLAGSDRVNQWMRVFVMQYFDGTLAGAWYMANEYRKVMIKYEEEQREHDSLDRRTDGKEGEGDTVGERISTEAGQLKGDTTTVANDIIALYNLETNRATQDMIDEILRVYYAKFADKLVEGRTKLSDKEKTYLRKMLAERDTLLAKYKELSNKKNRTDAEKRKLSNYEYAVRAMQKVLSALSNLQDTLSNMTEDELRARYSEIVNSEMTGTEVTEKTFDTKEKSYSKARTNIVARIKATGTNLVKLITSGKLQFESLPKEVQEMFVLKTYTSEDGKKTAQVYELKPEVYSVGRGRVALPGAKDKGRFNYVGKKELTTDNSAYRHDVSEILANDELLRETLRQARIAVKTKTTGDLKKTMRTITSLQKKVSEAIDVGRTSKTTQMKETRIKVKSAKRTSDVPNNFTIVSPIDMPNVLKDIFDTSFEDMADTKVQFASKDEAGNLYDKKTHGKKFDSRLKHEVSNWQVFYEANREELLALTRNDALDIIEYFQYGMQTINGPSGKLRAFELFVIGYIYDVAQQNTLNWNFSDAEIKVVRELWESKASEMGSGLNAVAQMQEVINPFKTVRQRMLDDYNITDTELKPYEDALTKLQKATTEADRKAAALEVTNQIKALEQLMKDRDPRPKGWFKRAWQKIKSYRFLSMLSSPMTWIRNQISNIALSGMNKASDAIGSLIFVKKGYRENQWNLAGTKISDEAKTFIDAYIKNNDIFDKYLYDSRGKYDDYGKNKKGNEHTMFVRMITSAIEQKYAANHRFDNGTFNAISKFIAAMISDKRFIKFATSRYFGKMLTIQVANGEVDLSKGLTDNVLELFAEAIVLANTDYMHKRSFLADMVDGLKEKHPVAYEALTLWQPFLNSSFNWFQETLKYTPVGLVNAIWRMCKLEQQITKIDEKRANGEIVPTSRVTEYLVRRDVGKGTLGLLLTILGAILGGTGVLKIEDDDDKFYMVVGDVKIDISNIFGTSSVLVGASIAQLWYKEEPDDETMGFDGMMRLTMQQMFEGFVLNDLLARHKWDEGFWDGMLTETESVLRSFVPQLWQLIIRCTNNEEIKYSPGMAGMWERWLNSFVPTQPLGSRKINPYTGEVESKYALPIVVGELLKSGLLGPKIYWYEMSELEEFARELGVNKNELTGELTVGDKKHKLDKAALNKKYGELNKASLAKIKSQRHRVEMPDGSFKTLSWDQMSDKQKANVIDRTMTQNATLAKIYIWTQVMGNKYYGSGSLYQMLRQLGIFKNVYKGDKGFVE